MKWLYRILQGLLAAEFLMAGMMKLFGSSEELTELYTEPLGYAVEFMRMVGALETLAAVGLIVGFRWSKIALASSGVLAVLMAGAGISLLTAGQGFAQAVLPFVLMLIALAVFFGKRPARTAFVSSHL